MTKEGLTIRSLHGSPTRSRRALPRAGNPEPRLAHAGMSCELRSASHTALIGVAHSATFAHDCLDTPGPFTPLLPRVPRFDVFLFIRSRVANASAENTSGSHSLPQMAASTAHRRTSDPAPAELDPGEREAIALAETASRRRLDYRRQDRRREAERRNYV